MASDPATDHHADPYSTVRFARPPGYPVDPQYDSRHAVELQTAWRVVPQQQEESPMNGWVQGEEVTHPTTFPAVPTPFEWRTCRCESELIEWKTFRASRHVFHPIHQILFYLLFYFLTHLSLF